eukprot:8745538-Lingulodinium_polyedra.AAC.1
MESAAGSSMPVAAGSTAGVSGSVRAVCSAGSELMAAPTGVASATRARLPCSPLSLADAPSRRLLGVSGWAGTDTFRARQLDRTCELVRSFWEIRDCKSRFPASDISK